MQGMYMGVSTTWPEVIQTKQRYSGELTVYNLTWGRQERKGIELGVGEEHAFNYDPVVSPGAYLQ